MSTTRALTGWLKSREPIWKRIAERISTRSGRARNVKEVNEVVHGYRSLARDLAVSRRLSPKGPLATQLERLFIQTHEYIHAPPSGGLRSVLRVFFVEGPAIFRKKWKPVAISTVLFVGTAVGGWLLTWIYPDTAGIFASETMIELVQNGELWTDGLLNIMPSSMISAQIIANNVVVTLFAFGLGALYGIGTLYIIGLNGLMLGSVLAFTAGHGLAGRLFDFIVAHGVVELSVIAIAGGLGVGLGEALAQPGNRSRMEALQEAVLESGKVLLVIVPYLIGAGIIEGFISPDPDFPRAVRVAVGLAYFALMAFHLYHGGRRRRAV